MNAEFLFGFTVILLVGIFMMGIGISNLRSHHPVGFYSGERPPQDEEITDIRAYNRGHGIMWILYGTGMPATDLLRVFGNSVLFAVPVMLEVLLGIILLIVGHHRLEKKYRRKRQ